MRRVVAAGALVLAAALTATAVAVAAPPAPRSPDQPARDGCQRSNGGILLATSPEWVYVYRNRTPRMAAGVAVEANPSTEDEPGSHRWYDFVFSVALDPRYRYLLGGDPARHIGNFSNANGERPGIMQPEWETGTLLPFAWPTVGDRVIFWGSWVWDCGHWRADPQNAASAPLSGERTELHPLQALVVLRHAPFRSRRGESQADAFISSNGTPAHAAEECALALQPTSPASFGTPFRDCVRAPRHFLQPLARSYSFFVPAPPRPSPGARLTYRVVRSVGTGTERVRVRPGGLEVTALPVAGERYGRTFYVGWSQPPRRPPARVGVTLDSLRILRVSDPNPRKPGQISQPPDELNLYLDVNGDWQFLDDWAPGLDRASLNQTFRIGRTLDVAVPAGQRVRLVVRGRECDEPNHSIRFGLFVPLIHPCPSNPNEFQIGNDSPGVAEATFPSARAALGRHRLVSRGGDGAFAATFTLRRLR